MQYVAMMLKNAGCSRVFGLTLVKSLGNNWIDYGLVWY